MEDPIADTRDIKRWFLSSFIESAQRSKGRIFDRWMRSVQAKAWDEGRAAEYKYLSDQRTSDEDHSPYPASPKNPYDDKH